MYSITGGAVDITHAIGYYADTTLIEVDGIPPTISILYPENKTHFVSDVPLTFTVSEPPSWIGYSFDGQKT